MTWMVVMLVGFPHVCAAHQVQVPERIRLNARSYLYAHRKTMLTLIEVLESPGVVLFVCVVAVAAAGVIFVWSTRRTAQQQLCATGERSSAKLSWFSLRTSSRAAATRHYHTVLDVAF